MSPLQLLYTAAQSHRRIVRMKYWGCPTSSYAPVSHEAPQAPTAIAATKTAASSSHHRTGRGVCQ